jgi:hypothetical protein
MQEIPLVTLSNIDASLNLRVTKKPGGEDEAETITGDYTAGLVGGVRATHGIRSGKAFFEVSLVQVTLPSAQ